DEVWSGHHPREICTPPDGSEPVIASAAGDAERSRAARPPDYPGNEADVSRVRTIPIARRPNKVSAEEFAHPPDRDRSFAAFLDALPHVLVADDFRRVVSAIADAARSKRGVIVMCGGHVVKTGLAPLLID